MNKKVIIIGAGGHAKVVADAIRKSGDILIGFLDDDKTRSGENFCGARILGTLSSYSEFAFDAEFIIAIGNNNVRKSISESMTCKWYTAVHPSASIGEGAILDEGAFVAAGAVINADARIGKHTIVNTCAVVEHDCSIGAFVHVSPRATVCGACSVGELSWLGAGSTVINGLTVCKEAVIGAGATVIRDIENKGTYVGVPARRLAD